MEEFSLNSFNLTDKVVLITGGASGLGQYYTQAVSKVGADVFIVSYDRQGWEETRAAVETNGRKAVFMLQDITEPGAAKKDRSTGNAGIWTNRCAHQQCRHATQT